jgi:hypothetical protein
VQLRPRGVIQLRDEVDGGAARDVEAGCFPRHASGDGHADRVVSFEEPVDRDSSREITEIIGWDPVAKSMRSWIFSSDGGFGEGPWSHDGERLVILVDGTLADGSPASGTLRITRLGTDEVSCEVSGEGIERLLPPAGDFLRTARTSNLP